MATALFPARAVAMSPVCTSCSAPTTTTGVSAAFGTFGELLQGVLPGRCGDFLVTLPIARWSRATFRVTPGTREIFVRPSYKWKALRMAEMVREAVGAQAGGVLTIDSTLPEGKGLASSSADLVAAARAVGCAFGVRTSSRFVERLLGRIEPTDGVLYPGIVAYDHRRVRLRARLGSLPPMAIVGVDEGGVVDTVAFNRVSKPFTAAERREYARLLQRLSAAVACRDLVMVGAVATRSAIVNQILHPKAHLGDVLRVCREVRGLGVVAAHSGTMLGVLFNMQDPEYLDKVAEAVSACSAFAGGVSVYRTLSFDRPTPP